MSTQAKKAPAKKASVKKPRSTPAPQAAPDVRPEPAPRACTAVRITDTSLRDAHQSLWATRMRTLDILEVLDVVDNVGFYSLECWGGATFDVCMRFLRENPWERLRQIKAIAKKTPLQMLLRGQNILGYKNYPDDVLDRFVAGAVKNGIDIFRTFDALNDNRNLEQAIACVKKYGGHAQGTICYTTSPVHTVAEYVRIAREQEQMGVDSICIKDMAGILSPVAAEALVSALAAELKVPIQVHTHATSGMGATSYFEAVRAGAGAIDCAVSALAGFSSQPPVETMVSMFAETEFKTDLDRDALKRMNHYFMKLRPLREPVNTMPLIIDPDILEHHIPGGMISNLRSQLAQQGALDRLDEVLQELPAVRADMGYPPLVTPTSQIVGVQAVLNVLSGKRYEMVTQETRDYVRGLYGRSPAPIDPKLKKLILGKEKPIDCRPADLLDPGLPGCVDSVDPKLIKGEEDILSFCLFPEPALAYFKWRDLAPGERPPIPADEELKEKERKLKKEVPSEPARPIMAPSDYVAIEGLMATVKQLGISELTIRRSDVAFSLRGEGAAPAAAAAEPLADAPAPTPAAAEQPAAAPAPAPAADANLDTIDAPLTGTFYRSSGLGKPNFVEEGGDLKGGEPICIIEAMKLFNQIKVEKPCKVVKFLVQHGSLVQKGTPLAQVEYR
ncbi:MAG: pyruvate carboxylase subunit B [Kiritimatiellia bacterium]|jgi:oxaloacetate decarboxylase alpha subunit